MGVGDESLKRASGNVKAEETEKPVKTTTSKSAKQTKTKEEPFHLPTVDDDLPIYLL